MEMKTIGRTCVVVNDIFDDLNEENKKLKNELMFANNCLKVLDKFKQFLNKIYIKFETSIDPEDKQEFNQLNSEFKSVIENKEIIIGSNVSTIEENFETNENNVKNEILLSENKTTENKTKILPKTSPLIEDNSIRRRRGRPLGSKSKPKPEPIECVIPDPEVEPNSMLLLRRNNFDEKTERYVCPNPCCGKSFQQQFQLNGHFQRVHCTTKQYICDHLNCGKRFRTVHELNRHLWVHSDIKQFVCDFIGCDFKFKSQINLKRHQLIHTTVPSFICEECNKAFLTKAILNHHKRRHQKSFKCLFDDCHQIFPNEYQMREHQFKDHNKQRTIFSCDWPGCEFSTTNNTKFGQHKRLHTGEKPYLCDWPDCGKRFRVWKVHKRHVLIHKDLKPCACIWPGCQYRCRESGELSKHMRVHKKGINK